jgi:hypothetical protein
MRFWKIIAWWALLVVLLASPQARAQEKGATTVAIPAPLQPWIPWVLHGKEEALCPVIQGGSATCAWPARVELSITDRGGSFTQRWRLDGPREAASLPGDGRRWPLDVKVDGKPAIVLARSGKPIVDLAPGEHEVTGRFAWDSLPESILVPPESGLVALSLQGESVPFPQRDAQGNVWPKKSGTEQEGDALEIVVHRRIDDDVLVRLLTRVQLAVSGKSREVLLGKALLPGFVPLALDTQLPARVEADGRLRIQARPGSFVVELTARSEGPVASLTRTPPALSQSGGGYLDSSSAGLLTLQAEDKEAAAAPEPPPQPQPAAPPIQTAADDAEAEERPEGQAVQQDVTAKKKAEKGGGRAAYASNLPGSKSAPQRVEVDGKPAGAMLLRDRKLYLALEPGSHDVVMEGTLPARETVQIALPLRPRQLTAAASGWKLEGLHEDGLADESL